ncbi:MAG: flagellar motor switch protein FliG, partial [Alicyclobacillus sp.]|nr:flagellar motor switch protein FliG [Alicyclobacillus sp.]
MPRQRGGLTGKQKAAILLISLGPDVASKIYKNLAEEEVEQLTLEIANLRKVDPELEEQVVREFRDIAVAKDYIALGG